MKALTLALTTFLLAAPAAQAARPSAAQEITGGLKFGLNISDFVGSDASAGYGTKAQGSGLVIGGYMVFPLRDIPFRLQPELLISVKGAVYKGDVLGTHYESRSRLTYLEIPVLARFDIESRSGAKPAILIGPSFGIKVSAESESHTIGASGTSKIDNLNAFDPGVALGGLVEIPAGGGAITLEARYTRSLVTIFQSTGGHTPDIKNSVISIMLGYRF